MYDVPRGAIPLLDRCFPARPTSAALIRAEVCAFAADHGAGANLLDDVALAVTEAAANVIRHAYPDGDAGIIEVCADVEDGTLEVVVADEGQGFTERPPDVLGAGLRLIEGCSASFGIDNRDPHGAQVWMRFLLHG